jgi:hypothetical protein
MSEVTVWAVYSECIDDMRSDYGAPPSFEGCFESRREADEAASALQSGSRAAWVEPLRELRLPPSKALADAVGE